MVRMADGALGRSRSGFRLRVGSCGDSWPRTVESLSVTAQRPPLSYRGPREGQWHVAFAVECLRCIALRRRLAQTASLIGGRRFVWLPYPDQVRLLSSVVPDRWAGRCCCLLQQYLLLMQLPLTLPLTDSCTNSIDGFIGKVMSQHKPWSAVACHEDECNHCNDILSH